MLRIALTRIVSVLLATGWVLASTLAAASDASVDELYQAQPNEAVIYYKRADGQYQDWGLHLWDGDGRTNGVNELISSTAWDVPLAPAGVHPDYGAYFIVPMTGPDWADFMFIVPFWSPNRSEASKVPRNDAQSHPTNK